MPERRIRTLLGNGVAVARAHWHLRGAELRGRRVRVWGRPTVVTSGTMIVGDRVRVFSGLAPVELVADTGGVLEIGEGTFINVGTSIAATKRITIGPRCNFGPHCMLMDNAFHRMEPERRHERPESLPIVIGENVWLGARVIVLPGVTIGDDSVIGAGSVVSRDVPSGVFAAGVPVAVIRPL